MKKSFYLYICLLSVCATLLCPASVQAQLALTPFKDGQIIGLRSASKHYVCAERDGNGDVIANRTGYGTWERFTVSLQADNMIALKAHTGKWVVAEEDHNQNLYANRDGVGAWEKFTVTYHGDNVISLKANTNGLYVQEDQNDDNRLRAGASAIGSWERFEVVSDPQSAAVTFESMITAIEKYAPKVYFQSGESYFPCSVEDFIAATVPANDHEGKPGLKISNNAIKAGNLAKAKAYVNLIIGSTYTDIQYWFLYGYNGAGTAYLKRFEPISWPPWESGRYHAIGDYSMSPGGQHEGDWEHVTVRIRNDNYE